LTNGLFIYVLKRLQHFLKFQFLVLTCL